MEFKKQNQNGGTSACIVGDCRSFVNSWTFTNEATVVRMLLKWKLKHTRPKFMPYWPLQGVCCKSEAILSEKFRPGLVIWAEVFVWENFHFGYRDLPYQHIEIFKKERVARRDLGNRASPVDRAHMKRHLRKQIYWGQINDFLVFHAFIPEFWSLKGQLQYQRRNLKRDKLCKLL